MSSVIDLCIIGAQKAGTSSFLRYLVQHPQICSHPQPEMNFFVNEKEYQQGYPVAFKRYFSACSADSEIVAAKSIGILDSETFIKRIYGHNPKMQVIILLRNPVDRAYSAYWFARRKGWENLNSFENALQAGPKRFAGQWPRELECSYLERGIYAPQVQAVFATFPKKQIHIFFLETVKTDIVGACQSLYRACGLEPSFKPEAGKRHNPATLARSATLAYLISNARPVKRSLRLIFPATITDKVKHALQRWNQKEVDLPEMNSETRRMLLDFYKPYNQDLSDLLGRELPNWNQ